MTYFPDLLEKIVRRTKIYSYDISFTSIADVFQFTALPASFIINNITVTLQPNAVTTAAFGVYQNLAAGGIIYVTPAACPVVAATNKTDLSILHGEGATQLVGRVTAAQAGLTARITVSITDTTP